MSLKKILKQWPVLLFFGCCGWVVYEAITYNDYYYGGSLKRLNVFIQDKPEYIFFTDPFESYYNFTIQNSDVRFRISEGAMKLVGKNDSLKRKVESIQNGDSISIDIKPEDGKKLAARSGKIRVIGLYINGKVIIDPANVKKAEADKKLNFWFTLFLIIIFYLILLLRLYFKRKKEKRMSAIPASIILIIITVNFACGHPESSKIQDIDKNTDSMRQVSDTNSLSRLDTGIPLHKIKSMNKYYPFELLDNTGYVIVAQIESNELYPKYYELFSKYNYEGNGYCWEGHIIQILEKLDKQLLKHIEFDPEAGAFFATADTKENQLKFVEALSPVFSDLEKLEGYIKVADRSRIDD